MSVRNSLGIRRTNKRGTQQIPQPTLNLRTQLRLVLLLRHLDFSKLLLVPIPPERMRVSTLEVSDTLLGRGDDPGPAELVDSDE